MNMGDILTTRCGVHWLSMLYIVIYFWMAFYMVSVDTGQLTRKSEFLKVLTGIEVRHITRMLFLANAADSIDLQVLSWLPAVCLYCKMVYSEWHCMLFWIHTGQVLVSYWHSYLMYICIHIYILCCIDIIFCGVCGVHNIQGKFQYKHAMLRAKEFPLKKEIVARPFYLCNGDLHTSKDGLYIETGPNIFQDQCSFHLIWMAKLNIKNFSETTFGKISAEVR